MAKQRFGRKPHGEVIIDVCWDCHALWFDQYESTSLTPRAVVDLFQQIHEHRDKPARTLGDRLACPHCSSKLALTQDVLRSNRFTYHRCTRGHGRLTTFFQFLREKHFVRSLTPLEIHGLRATVKQVRCSGCGGSVDLAADAACSYCRSPISVLDDDAVRNALATLNEAERKRASIDPEALANAFDSLVGTHKSPRGTPSWSMPVNHPLQGSPVVDLLVAGIGRLFR